MRCCNGVDNITADKDKDTHDRVDIVFAAPASAFQPAPGSAVAATTADDVASDRSSHSDGLQPSHDAKNVSWVTENVGFLRR